MDPGTLATITGLAGAAKTSIEAIRAAFGSKDQGAQKALAPAITDPQAHLFEFQEISFRLSRELSEAKEENAQLREQIRQEEERAADRESYELRHVGGDVAIVDKKHPEVYLCATCFEAGAKVYLTKMRRDFVVLGAGTHTCPKCKATIGAH